jgi:hypothetical protein
MRELLQVGVAREGGMAIEDILGVIERRKQRMDVF